MSEAAKLMHRALAGDRLVIVHVKEVYGRTCVYPVSPAAQAIARLTGTKTLTLEALGIARELGFEVVEDPRPRLGVQS
jgi:hypothetical protein